MAAAVGRRGLDNIRRSTLLAVPASSVSTSTAYTASANVNATRTIRANTDNLLTHHHHSAINVTQQQQQSTHRYLSSVPEHSPPTTDLKEVGDGGNKGIFGKLWDKYSFEGQKKRIILGERLFRSAQFRANDP